jgi:arginine/lysine/ornithine decarboxylase
LVIALKNIRGMGTRKAMSKAPVMFFKTPETSIMPWEAVYYEREKIEAEKSIGRICGEMIIPYPPGIPVLIPGEIISREVYEYLKLCLGEGVKINGASDAKLEKVWVIKTSH